MNKLMIKLDGDNKTRGEFGVTASVAHLLVWDNEENGWREATQEEAEMGASTYGVFDPDFGWIAPWPID